MDDLLLIVVTFASTLCSVYLGWTLRRWQATAIAAETPRGPKVCDVCERELPIGTRRTHDGHWRCAEHKATRASCLAWCS